MSYEQIRYEVSEGILTLTLHRPDKLNAFTATMAKEVIDAFDAADADDDVRVVVVTGAGRAFCAGADLSAGGDTFDPRVRGGTRRSEEHTSELQSHVNLVCRLLLEKKKKKPDDDYASPPMREVHRA